MEDTHFVHEGKEVVLDMFFAMEWDNWVQMVFVVPSKPNQAMIPWQDQHLPQFHSRNLPLPQNFPILFLHDIRDLLLSATGMECLSIPWGCCSKINLWPQCSKIVGWLQFGLCKEQCGVFPLTSHHWDNSYGMWTTYCIWNSWLKKQLL